MMKTDNIVACAYLIAITFFLSLLPAAAQIDVAFPSDAGVYNVTNPKYNGGAVGDGVTDDTLAFEMAISDALNAGGSAPSNGRYAQVVILYIPNGTYILSNTLHNWDGYVGTGTNVIGGWIAGMYLQGQSQSGTILKLQGGCPGFTNASSPKAMIQTGSEDSLPGPNEPVSAITSSSKTATATCTAHGYQAGQVVTISGASPAAYSGRFVVASVIDANTFTYTMASAPGTNATGTIGSTAYTGQMNQAFRHYIRNMTIDVGVGNPGAVGVDFLTSNRGGIFNVTVQSSDPGLAGYTGIMMDRNYPGPGLIKNVTVKGFNTGISMRNVAEYGMTFDNITLNNQLTDGMVIAENTASIYNLTSNNTVPVIATSSTTAHLTLVNGTFINGLSTNTAITGTASIYARNINSTGYGTVIGTIAGGASPVNVPEYESAATAKDFATNINGSADLPIQETPDFNDTNTTADWANGTTGGPVGGDYLPCIQNAINSGKPVVYLPQGSYTVSDTIHLAGSVQKFIGCCAYLTGTSNFPPGHPLIQFDGGTGSFTDIQNFRINGSVTDTSTKTLVIENCDLDGTYTNTSTGTGNLFLEDVMSIGPNGAKGYNIAYPQYVWARQLNVENIAATYFTNNGGYAWLFGYKTESTNTSGSILVNQNSGWTELLGGFAYGVSTPPSTPLLYNNNGFFSANYAVDVYGVNFSPDIKDTEGTTGTYTGTNVSLYSGTDATFAQPTLTGEQVGTYNDAGNFTFDPGSDLLTVQGQGIDQGHPTADQYFFAQQAVSGDCTITAEVDGFQNALNSQAAGGVMIRETGAAGSRFAMVQVLDLNYVEFTTRATANTASGNPSVDTSNGAPYWVQLVRRGNNFTAYRSPDGSSWTQMGTAQSITMQSGVQIGLIVDSNTSGSLATVKFYNVTVTTP
jgi:hypothetical protein